LRPKRGKRNYYLDMAQAASFRSTCKHHMFGAIIVKQDEVIATGYNGSPRGADNCIDVGCSLEMSGICRGVCAEENVIISSSRREMIGSTMYISCVKPGDNGLEVIPLTTLASLPTRVLKLLINSGVSEIVMRVTSSEFVTFSDYDFLMWFTKGETWVGLEQ
jgi:dCMP deaminase